MWLDQLSVGGELQPVRGSFAFIPAAADRSYSLRVAMPTGDLALKIGGCAQALSGSVSLREVVGMG